MPVQKAKSQFLAKLGGQIAAAHEAHKNDDIDWGQGGDLPGGIENGIAQLVDCKFDMFKNGKNQGKYYFMAAAAVVSPAEFKDKDGVTHRIEGLRTTIGPEPMCDTPDRQSRPTFNEHYAWVLNELRKLGVNTADLEFSDLEATVAALKEQQPHIKFRTWKGEATKEYPNPRTNHVWGGVVEHDGANDDPTAAVEDNSGSDAGSADDATPADAGDEDLDALAEKADGGDTDAMAALKEKALTAGCDEGEVDNADNWAAVVEMINNADGDGSVEDTPAEPTVGETWNYKPVTKDPKTKKDVVAKKAVACEITAINESKKTCTLKNVASPKVLYKDIPLAALEEATA